MFVCNNAVCPFDLQRMYPSSAKGSYPFRMIDAVDQGDIQINGTLDFELGQREYVYQVFADVSVWYKHE